MPRRKNAASALIKRNIQRSPNQFIMRKGMELPINTLVIVAIAVIVILAIAAFFMGGFGGSSKDVQNRQNFLNACSGWVQTGCNNANYDDSIKDAYVKWQPTRVDNGNIIGVDYTKDNAEKDYLASMCGCFGAGTGTRTSTATPTGTGTKTTTTTTTTPSTTLQTCQAQGGTCDDMSKCISGTDRAVKSSDCTATGKSCCIKGGASTENPNSLIPTGTPNKQGT